MVNLTLLQHFHLTNFFTLYKKIVQQGFNEADTFKSSSILIYLRHKEKYLYTIKIAWCWCQLKMDEKKLNKMGLRKLGRGAWYLTGENLKVVWDEFSTLS